MKLLFVVTLFVLAAQILPSCGGEREVVGWVEEKFDRGARYFIMINYVEYMVPFPFWNNVGVGDLVKFDGTQWTIVKKASEYR